MQFDFQNVSLRIIKKKVFLGACCAFVALTACALKTVPPTPPLSPEGAWTYPGGSAEPMSIIFNADGTLTFVGGFLRFNPSTWQYDQNTQKLRVKVPGNEIFETYCSSDAEEEYACLHFNKAAGVFECRLTEKTKSINFLGWNFLRQQKNLSEPSKRSPPK